MPSSRRLRVIGLLIALAFLIVLYITSGARQTRQSAFYTKTRDALAAQREAKEASLGSLDSAADGAAVPNPKSDAVAARLREAEEAAKKAADTKAEQFHGEDVVEDKRKERLALERQQAKQDAAKKAGPQKAMGAAGGGSGGGSGDDDAGKKTAPETEEEHLVREELNAILKRSPIIIFSKTYCPYSRKAKAILLERYKITPPPFVVELDREPLGPQLQAELGSITGRRTVPNILVQGKSIGGGDDVEALHRDGKIVDTIKGMLGKRVEIAPVPAAED